MKTKIILIILVELIAFMAPLGVLAKSGRVLNFAKDINWGEIFPMKIAGMEVTSGDQYDGGNMSETEGEGSMDCECPLFVLNRKRKGVPFGMWVPDKFIETVHTPYYSPMMGDYIAEGAGVAFNVGMSDSTGTGGRNPQNEMFQNAHVWTNAAWKILGSQFTDQCFKDSETNFDLAYMTELDSMWADDAETMILQPEVLLFATVPGQLACVVDAAATILQNPIKYLHWCVASGGSIFPLTGNTDDANLVQGNSTIAAKMIFKMYRMGLWCDPAQTLCFCVNTVIWDKTHLKIHNARPKVRTKAWPVGTTQFFYSKGLNTQGRNPADEFLWVIFRKFTCCKGSTVQ